MSFHDHAISIRTDVLKFETIRQVTELPWVQVDLAAADPGSSIPFEQGVYAWVQDSPSRGLIYHGSGSGKDGLNGRLRPQLRWRTNQLRRLSLHDASPDYQLAWELAAESPAIRAASENDVQLWISPAQPATWVSTGDVEPPASALHWEALVSEVSHLVTGNRSLFGGGAWESKANSINDLMCELAWLRLLDIGASWRE